MTTTIQTPPTSRRTTAVVIATVMLAMVAVGYLAGRTQRMHTDTASCLSAEQTISCDLGDGSHARVPTDVAWTDSAGAHESGRPACLPPTGIGLEGPVRLTWTTVEADGRSWRQVVSVGC